MVIMAALVPAVSGPGEAAPKPTKPTKLPKPAVTRLDPRTGSTAGGTVVTIKGKHLTTTKTVLFGKAKGTKVKVKSDRKLTVVSPPHAEGVVDVTVKTKGGKSASTAPPQVTPTTDVTYPSLGRVTLTERHTVVSPNGTKWIYLVPAGWKPSNVETSRAIAPGRVDKLQEVRWRPPDEPSTGGYSVRFKALNPRFTPEQLSDARIQGMRSAVEEQNQFDFHILAQPTFGLRFTYIDGETHFLRYNFFRWITSNAGFAMGPSRVNPYNGQILDADIIFDADFVSSWKEEYETFTAETIAETAA